VTAIRQQLYTTSITSGSVAPSLLFKMLSSRHFFFLLNYPPVFLMIFLLPLGGNTVKNRRCLCFLLHRSMNLKVFVVLWQIPSELSFLNRRETEDGGEKGAMLVGVMQPSPEGSCSSAVVAK